MVSALSLMKHPYSKHTPSHTAEHSKKSRVNKRHMLDNSLALLGGICIFFILILGAFSIMIYYKGFYTTEYEKNNVYQNMVSRGYAATPTDAELIAQNITTNTLQYFRGKDALHYFTPEEQSHLQDVKSLISTMNALYYGSVVIFILLLIGFYIRYKKDMIHFIRLLSRMVLIGSIAALILIIAIFLLAVFYFNPTFILFHLLFFPQGNWIFANTSLLITLFPEQFFFDITLRIFVYALAQAAVFLIIGWWLSKQVKLHEEWHQ